MHVHIINEWNVVSGPAEGTVSQEWRIARTHDRQWRKRKSTVLYYPRSTTEVQLYVPAVLEHSPWLSRRRDLCPNSRCHVARDDTKTYVCIYIWCVCALNARQYATLPRLTPTERHVVTYDVWVFPAHPSLCAALPDLTAAVLSSLVTAVLPNGRYQCSKWSCWRHSLWRIARTHDRQWRKRKSTVLYYPRSTTEVQLYVPAVLEHSSWLSRRRDLCPNSRCHVWRTKHMCAYIYGVCVRWMPDSMQRCHVWAYRAPRRHVWRVGFPSAPLTVCGVARSDCCSVVQSCDCSVAKRTVSMLSTLLFRMSVSLKNCIIHRRRACLYMLSTTEGARRAMQV